MTHKIYKLVSNKSDKIFIGSTSQPLNIRKRYYKQLYNQYQKGDKLPLNIWTLCLLFKYGGDFSIELIEEYTCDNIEQLKRRKLLHIKNNDNAINCHNIHKCSRKKGKCDEIFMTSTAEHLHKHDKGG